MSRLLPREPPADGAETDPLVVGFTQRGADDILAALASETPRTLLARLYDGPATQSELADHVETSIQNVDYHLDTLERVGLVDVVDRCYSEKGREMDVYAPAGEPLVLLVGDDGSVSAARRAVEAPDAASEPGD